MNNVLFVLSDLIIQHDFQIHITFLDYERKECMYLYMCLGRGGFGYERGRKRILSKTALYKTGIFEAEGLLRV